MAAVLTPVRLDSSPTATGSPLSVSLVDPEVICRQSKLGHSPSNEMPHRKVIAWTVAGFRPFVERELLLWSAIGIP